MNRRGIALVAALVAMLLAGILAATILAAARLQWLAGHRLLAARQALPAAEGIANWEVAHWDSALADLPIGLTVPLARPSVPGLVRSNASVVRLGPGLYLIRAVVEVTDREGGVLARDGVAQLVGESGDSGSRESGINRVPAGAWWRWP
jgi:hypothetical protein